MPYRDLRAFLKRLEELGQLAKVQVEVDPKYEIGAICRKALRDGGIDQNPAIFFQRVRGSRIPVVTNVLDSRPRYYLALETTREQFLHDYIHRTARPVSPRIVERGPCQQNVLEGSKVDLGLLPIPVWNEKDGGPYITMTCVIHRDPETGTRNAGTYRLMVHDRQTLGILVGPQRELHQQCVRAHAKGESVPVAIAIGLDPSIYAASIAPFPYGVDELAMAGALRGEAVDLVTTRTIPLEVPATSEIVLEGEIRPNDRLPEGPFGEFTGYYSEGPVARPVIRLSAMTFRDDLIYQGVYEGRPPTCDSVAGILPHEAEILRQVRMPELKRVRLSAGGAMFLAVAALSKRYDGQERTIAQAILATPTGRWIKTLILVDEDIDPDNWFDVEWALGTRFQPREDILTLHNMGGIMLDPSLPPDEVRSGMFRTSKVIIDATRPVALPFGEICQPHPDIMQQVERQWERYGIPAKI